MDKISLNMGSLIHDAVQSIKKSNTGEVIWNMTFVCVHLTFHCQQVANPITCTYLLGDVAILINIIEVKSPVELLSDRTSEQHWQADDKVLKANWTISVDVERVEQEVGVGGGICGQKESGS